MFHTLSKREIQVFFLIADGLSNRSISQKLSISESTVENHIHHIYEKLGITNRAQAIAMAFSGEITPPYKIERKNEGIPL